MRVTLLFLGLLSGCLPLTQSGYQVTEVQLLFPEATERWVYFYGEPRTVALKDKEQYLPLEDPKEKTHPYAVPGALWVEGRPFLREVGPALSPRAEAVQDFFGRSIQIRTEEGLERVWLYDGRGWIQLAGGLEEGSQRTLILPATYTTIALGDLRPQEAAVILQEILARRQGRPVVLFELKRPVLKALALDPPPDAYRRGVFLIQYGLKVEVVPPPPPAYRILAQGAQSAYTEGAPKAFLARTEGEWREVWSLATQGRIPQPPLPPVDFGRRAVAAFFWGLKPTGGYGLQVLGVTQSGRRAQVVLDLRSPPPGSIVTQALTSPYVLLEIPRVEEVVFVDPGGRVLAVAP